MTRRRAGLVALFGAALLALAAEPVAAQPSASTTVEQIWILNMNLLYVAIPITVLVEGILIYTVWKFRNNDDPLPTKENRRLEITWTVATAIVLLFVGYASYGVMANGAVTTTPEDANNMPEDAVEVEVVGQKYIWNYNYPDQGIEGASTLVIPKDRPVYLNVTSTDWIHSFHVPEMGLKQDALPNQHNVIKTTPTDTGTYTVYCAEYCGVGHSNMLSEVEVRTQEGYQQWLNEQGATGANNSTSGNSSAA